MSEGKVQILTQEEYEAQAEKEMDGTFHALAVRPRPYPIPRSISRKNVENAFHTAFELVGGTPRLAIWANDNPTDFYKLYSRMLPQQMDSKVQGAIQLVVPRSPLDD
jgi:hypothetical protein